MEQLLKIENLTKRYATFTLDHLNLSLPGGAIMGFVGENGAGKTTTIKLILNAIRRDEGSIQVFGLDNQKDEVRIKEQIGVVFDECGFHYQFTAQHVGKMLSGVYRSWDDGLYQSLLKRFQVPKNKTVKELSKGMKMKLSIAAALAHRPKLLILDEATSGLDPIVRDEFLDLFLEFIQDDEHSIFFSSHITSDLEKVADYIAFIHQGKLILNSPKDEIIENYGVIKCGAADLERLDPADVVAIRRGGFENQALTANRAQCARKYRSVVIDPATIDEIMLFYIKGEQE